MIPATTEDITLTHPNDWKYVSEGGATIVFSYVGPPPNLNGSSTSRVKNRAFEGMVLRLRKVPAVPLGVRFDSDSSSSSSEDEGEGKEEEEEDEPDDPSIAFQKQCMRRLVPKEHLPRLESINVRSPSGRGYTGDHVAEGMFESESGHHHHHHHHHHHGHSTDGSAWLRALAATHDESRPQARRNLGGIDFRRRKGVLATDLVGGHGMSIEIKPKWSFLPNSSHLSAETRPIKSNTCRFCMHSHMRTYGSSSKSEGAQVQNHGSGGVSAVGYCPLDLFSPNPERVRQSVYALYDAWIASEGKANNLKVFVDGKGVKVHQRNLVFTDPSTNIEDDQIRTALADGLLPLLTHTPVLQLLNRLQRSLDMLDVEGLITLWENWTRHARPAEPKDNNNDSTPVPIGAECSEPTLEEWGLFIDRYLQELGLEEGSGEGPACLQKNGRKGKYDKLPEVQTEEEMRYYLLAYLLSATFKDCSIIVRIPLLGSEKQGDVDVDLSKITLIDLDPKSMTRLKKWEDLDREIVDVYSKLGEEERRRCVDDW